MGDIFREVDEELRQENLEKFWKKNGRYVVVAAVVVVVVVAAYTGWREYDRGQREAEGAQFAAAKMLLQEGKLQDAGPLFAKLADESQSGYALLARFHQAALRAENGDRTGAIQVYDEIAADDAVAPMYRDAATILSGLHAVNGTSPDTAALLSRLEPLTAEDNAWRHSANEILGFLAQKSGDLAKARQHFQAIADDVDAPQGIRARATQMLEILGS